MPHDHYNKTDFPIFIINRGAWDLYANADGRCASIPVTEESGHKASHFGDWRYVRATLGIDVLKILTDASKPY